MNDKTLIMSMLKDVANMLMGELNENDNCYIRAAVNYVGCAMQQLEVYERVKGQ